MVLDPQIFEPLYFACSKYRGSFRTNCHGGQKVDSENIWGGEGGASLVMFPHLTQCSQVPRGEGARFWQRRANASLCHIKEALKV